METPLPLIDVGVIVVYLALVVGMGLWLARDTRQSEDYMAAHRSLPGWAVGLSIFGSYISSISFLANPGSSFESNWGPFVFSLTTPIAAWIAIRWFVPFYRNSGHVSAYEHLEERFGAWARTYAVICFLLTQMARMGTIVYLLALALAPVAGVRVEYIILIVGSVMTVYTVLGGIKAAIWTGVLQAFVLLVGPIICVVLIADKTPDGFAGIVKTGTEAGKFSLGSFDLGLGKATFWVVLFYGFVVNLQNFAVDQSYVQRYVTAKSDADARRSVWLGAWLYVPVAALFFFIGTALFALKTGDPTFFPDGLKPDAVFPWFINNALPTGIRGLVIAALLAAAMDPNLSSMATLTYGDLYKRYFRPQAGEKESMLVLRLATLGWGIIGTVVALFMIQSATVLGLWWKLAGVFGGGMLGLFLLGFMSKKATPAAALTGTIVGVLLILWMTFTPLFPEQFAGMVSPFHNYLVIVFGTLAILGVGLLVSTRRGKDKAVEEKPKP
ncbi:MAG: sodium:solute symporter [Verrucomicrobia bacterium]|jgi:SSS family solute:Na+ symporter|nr:sodium:solute symporter [Verrucomicrobiota bacterium]